MWQPCELLYTCYLQEVLYLSALLALKKAESQDKVIDLLSKTVEMHLAAMRVSSALAR